jgi:hypothetical protein
VGAGTGGNEAFCLEDLFPRELITTGRRIPYPTLQSVGCCQPYFKGGKRWAI